MSTISSSGGDITKIKAPQALIHIEHKVTLLQYKYWMLMLGEFKRQHDLGAKADETLWCYLPLSELKAKCGYVPNKKELWDDLEALKNQTIAYNVLSKDGGAGTRGHGFISEWEVHAKSFRFKMPSFIVDLVKGLDAPKAIFHMLNWEIFNAFTGKYEAVLYKLCYDYRGVRKTPYMTLDDFRRYMGIEEHEYKEFKELNRVVITKPVKIINESVVSDLKVLPEYEKQGRKVVGLRFLIEPKQQTMFPFKDDNPAFRFAKVHIDARTQTRYLAIRHPEQIELCIARANEYGEDQVKKGKREPNYGALYRKAIDEGWHETLVAREKATNVEKQRKVEEETKAKAKAAEESAKNAEIRARIDSIFNKFDTLDEELKDDIREQFRATLTITLLRKSFDRQGEQAPLVRSQFAEFLLKLWEHEKATR